MENFFSLTRTLVLVCCRDILDVICTVESLLYIHLTHTKGLTSALHIS